MIEHVVDQWHRHLRGELPGGLDALLDDEVVFYSPIVYTPQRGKAVTARYLQAAAQALPGDPSPAADARGGDAPLWPSTGFRYTKKVLAGDTAASESALINAAKLALHQTVIITQLLLLDQAEAVIGVLAAGLRAMHARTVISTFQIFRWAKDRHAKAAADANAGTCVTSHRNL